MNYYIVRFLACQHAMPFILIYYMVFAINLIHFLDISLFLVWRFIIEGQKLPRRRICAVVEEKARLGLSMDTRVMILPS